MAAAKDRLRAGVAKVARVAALAKRLSTIVAPGAAGGALAALSMATGGAGSGGGGSGRLLAGIASIRNLLGPTSSSGMVGDRAAATATEGVVAEAAKVAAGGSKAAAAAGSDAAQRFPEAESGRAGSSQRCQPPAPEDAPPLVDGERSAASVAQGSTPAEEGASAAAAAPAAAAASDGAAPESATAADAKPRRHAAPQNVKLDPIVRRLFGAQHWTAWAAGILTSSPPTRGCCKP